ncbi:ATP-binding protein [Natranaerofaba carboxydovora]|uniref:ATP-binding protein n=1 Tax=Natranaerofaba carboxydovora TaxID=2742683 RepID=UPI001F136D50|nr:ATP-binding protein [Natranaerofaba carboxydovora]UMZ72650.1 Magnesium-chelatase 38 kDa subunit [Natranaerofaba carboxydovora]
MVYYNELIKHSGNSHLVEASEIAILSILKEIPFHLHAEGPRGTGKTTILRSVKNVLPEIKRIKDCEYNCDPNMPHCPLHKNLTEKEVEKIGYEYIQIPYFEISHTAKPGTVAGSIDLKKLTDSKKPLAALLPGIIPRAHRGIIFVDEINRLADTSPELADILLDVMGTKPGKIQIEETGLEKVELPVNVSVWAASNPDEDPGSLEDIRRQLSDRFDFSVLVERPREKEVVEKILQNKNFLDTNIYSTANQDTKTKNDLLSVLSSDKNSFELEKSVEKNLAHIYVNYKLESLRALKALRLGSILKSAVKGKKRGELQELLEVTPMALKHRVDKKTLSNIIDYLKKEKEEPTTTEEKLDYPSKNYFNENNDKKTNTRKNFIKSLLDKFKMPGPTSSKGTGDQSNKSCSHNNTAKSKSNATGNSDNNSSKSCQSGGSGVQMKPDENNMRAPEVDAKPISELVEKGELIKKGEKDE